MKKRTAGLFTIAALLCGCSGAMQSIPTVTQGAPQSAGVAIRTFVRIRIPHRSRTRDLHPSTISPLTQSVVIQIGATPTQWFNTTPSSPGCVAASAGTTCTFAVRAPAGTDTFTVTTYSGVNASGSALDRGVATVPIAKGKANRVAVTLGPLVTTVADNGPGSLRYAVGTANSGDTIVFALPAGSTIALASPIRILGNVTIAGPGAAKLAISGGSTHQLFLIEGKATISGLTLTHGKAATPGVAGGTLYNAGSLTLANDIVGNSVSIVTSLRRADRAIAVFDKIAHLLHPHTCTPSVTEGGAIYNRGSLVSSGTQFVGNVAESDTTNCINGEGGAIYIDDGGSLSSTDDTFNGNAAVAGGAVYNAGLGAVTFNHDAFENNKGCTAATGCPTTGCTAGGCTANASGAGAAIFDGGFGITVLNSTFTSNVAGGATPGAIGIGGALFLTAGSPTIQNDTFTGNVAGGGTSSCSTGQGGAIAAAVPIELDSDVFKNNVAKGDESSSGGAVDVPVGSVTGNGDTFSGNVAIASGGSCTSSSTAGGGAAYSAAAASFTNTTFTDNSVTAGAIATGGAVYAVSATLIGDTFTSNKATANGGGSAGSTVAAGGAAFVRSLLKIGGSTFASNTAALTGPAQSTAAGGAVALVSGNIVSGGSTFTSNASTGSANTESFGGAIAVLTGSLASSGDTFASNAAKGTGFSGGGAIFSASSPALSNVTVSSNIVTGGTEAVGGGIAMGSPAGTLNNVTVTGNSVSATAAAGLGGGIFDSGGSAIVSSTIAHNTASNGGGGIASIGSTAETIVSTSVSDNAVTHASIAGSGGGGVYETSGLDVAYSTFAANTVATSGAGPAGGGGIFSGGDILAIGVTISGNAVTGSAPGGGGGIFSGAPLTLMDSTVGANSTSKDGGGIDIASNVAATLLATTIYKNVATGHGGNIDNQFPMTQLTNSIVAGGTAAAGADIYNSSTIASGDYNIIETAVAGNALAGTTTHDKTANPELLALADNGGATFTYADQTASPGRSYIPYSGGMCGGSSLTVDQRDYTRGAGGKCDVGAYEYAGVATAIRHRAVRKLRVSHHVRGLGVAFPRAGDRLVKRP